MKEAEAFAWDELRRMLADAAAMMPGDASETAYSWAAQCEDKLLGPFAYCPACGRDFLDIEAGGPGWRLTCAVCRQTVAEAETYAGLQDAFDAACQEADE